MKHLHDNQRKILEFLLGHHGGATLDELGAHLGLTRTAVQQHVLRLLDLGCLTYEDARGAVGRPRRRYLISDEGIDVFPKKYSWLANAILAQLALDLGPGGSRAFMKNLAGAVAASLESQVNPANPPAQRLRKVTALMNDLGYRAVLKPGEGAGEAAIEAVNCVYHSVAKAHPELCQFDVSLIEQASGMSVHLETCIAKGGAVCRFCVAKAAKGTSG
ncbi:helix-turn-helix transcriptional regulator [Geothrix mesophila]|uniref:helix-turn-helix transcriptional regulator n=1 Tax=Geothrix mesophila TaxID=2922723 RepID=UPI001FAB96B0|nr:MarR family transcriptional regulator [Geothrix sp. SG198]